MTTSGFRHVFGDTLGTRMKHITENFCFMISSPPKINELPQQSHVCVLRRNHIPDSFCFLDLCWDVQVVTCIVTSGKIWRCDGHH